MKTKNSSLFCCKIAAAFAVTLTLFASQSAHAQSGTWLPADGNWSDTAGWSGGTIANGANFTASFTTNSSGNSTTITTTLDGNRTIGNINRGGTISSVNLSWTITSPTNVLTLSNSSGNSSISSAGNGNYLLLVDTDIVLNSNLILSGNGNANAKVTLGATVGGRTITGAGNITFNNTNSFGGGALVINSNINTTGGIFNNSVAGSNALQINGNIGSGVTGVTQNGNRTLTLSGNNTYTGATTVNLGTLSAGVASVAGVSGAFGNNSAVTIANAAANLNLNGFNTQIGSLAGGGASGGTVTIGSATLTVGGDNTNTTYSGNITGNGNLTKIGNGTLTLTGNNPFTGSINVNAGNLVAGRDGIADINNATAVNLNGGTLELQTGTGFGKTYSNVGINVSSASTLAYNNTSNTTATLTFSGTNAFALGGDLTVRSISSNTTLTNGITISRNMTGSGDLTVETNNNISSAADVYNLGRVALSGDNSAWSGNLTIAKGTVTIQGSSLTGQQTGTGILTLGSTSDGAGLTFFNAAPSTSFQVNNDVVVAAGGFRSIKGANTSNGLIVNGNVTLNTNLNLDHTMFGSNALAINGDITGAGGLDITRNGGDGASSVTLTGTNNYLGATTIASGARLLIGNGGTSGSVTSDIANEGTLVFNRSNDSSYDGAITGAGTVTKTGNGTLTLGGTSNYGGNATVTNGTLIIAGAVTTPVTTVASAARIGGDGAITGNLVLDPNAQFVFTLGSTLDVSGTVSLDNTFSIASLVTSSGGAIDWSSVANGTYTLINNGSDFSNIDNFGLANKADLGGGKEAYFQNGSLQLVVIPEPSTWALLAVGMTSFVVFRRRRRA